MASERQFYGAHGIGKWNAKTKRYIPIGGGSRSRLPLEIKGLRPYRGFAGVDTAQDPVIDSIDKLYAKMEEGLEKINQSEAYLARDRAVAAALAEQGAEDQVSEAAPPPQVEEEPTADMPAPESPPPVIPLAQVEFAEKMAKLSEQPSPFETLETVPAQQPAPVETVAEPAPSIPVEQDSQEEVAAAAPVPPPAAPPAPPPAAPQPQQEEAAKSSGDDILFTFEL